MKKIKALLLAAICLALFSLSAVNVSAQGRGNFDPAQWREDMISRYKEQMNVTDDAEWKVISDAIGKVFDARQEVMASAFGGMRGGGGNRDRGRGGDTNNATGGNRDRGRGRGGMFGAPGAEMEDLQKAIDAKAPKDEIKSKLAKLREANAAKEAKLESAQADLKKLLTTQQEAVAVVGGLLK